MSFNIAIDGPAGAGKSTIAKMVANKLGFVYVDTGAMYRAIALYMLRNQVEKDEEQVSKQVEKADVKIVYADGEQQVLLNGENVSAYIRTEEVGNMASFVAKTEAVRAKLLELQRNLAATEDVIMDGRDIGTHVLPNAEVKIYLTASSAERANRRYKELCEKGVSCNLKEIEKDIIARDEQDMNRKIAPLKQAADARLIDSSHMNIEQVVEEIIGIYESKKR